MVNTPFLNKADACNRLLRYHVFYEELCSQEDVIQEEKSFEETADCILTECQLLRSRYQTILLNDSMVCIMSYKYFTVFRVCFREMNSWVHILFHLIYTVLLVLERDK